MTRRSLRDKILENFLSIIKMHTKNEFSLENLQKLSRIQLRPEEKQPFFESLSQILQAIEQLQEINTENVPPCNYVLQRMQETVMREDVPGKTLSREDFLSNAPDQISGMIRVPPVIKF